MNPQENQAELKQDGTNTKFHPKLLPKTIAEIEEVQSRVRTLYVRRKYTKRDPKSIQKPKVKTISEKRIETIQRQKDIADYSKSIGYSKYYFDDEHEYRHVILPKILAKWLPHHGILKEEEWTSLGVSQSSGWKHFMVYAPEPHILLFKREKGYLKKHGLEGQMPTREVPETVAQEIPPKQSVRSTRSSVAAAAAAAAAIKKETK